MLHSQLQHIRVVIKLKYYFYIIRYAVFLEGEFVNYI